MNRTGLYFGLAYAITVIIFKLSIVMGGYSLTTFGWRYSHITSVFLVIPFYYFAVRTVRTAQGGFIAGRDAARIALTVFVVGAILVSVYNYFEFEMSGKNLAIQYYNSQDFLNYLKSLPPQKVKPEDYPKIIQEQIRNAEVSSFKATTGKLFSFLIIGMSSAFITAALMKRAPR